MDTDFLSHLTSTVYKCAQSKMQSIKESHFEPKNQSYKNHKRIPKYVCVFFFYLIFISDFLISCLCVFISKKGLSLF